MSTVLYAVYALASVLLVGWGFAVWRHTQRIGTFLVILVTLGVAYDSLILALGNALGAGPLLLGLSVPRFVLHQLILPWLIYAAYEQAKVAGHGWANHRASKWIMLTSVLLLIALGVLTRLVPLNLEATVMDGVTRYVAVGTVGPPLVSILSIGFVGVVGLLLWRKNGWSWEFLAALLVFVGEAIPVEWVRRSVGSGLEILLLAVMLTTDRWLALRQDWRPMPVVAPRTLNVLAALVWYIGGIVLLLKGGSLLAEAQALGPGQVWPRLAIFTALVAGSLQARFLFSKSCRKNLERISALDQPMIWQFYRPGFFGFLVLMIVTGATLSRLAHNNYPLLIGVGALDLNLAVALLASSYVYWQRRAFFSKRPGSPA
jgi:hypothetical protein